MKLLRLNPNLCINCQKKCIVLAKNLFELLNEKDDEMPLSDPILECQAKIAVARCTENALWIDNAKTTD